MHNIRAQELNHITCLAVHVCIRKRGYTAHDSLTGLVRGPRVTESASDVTESTQVWIQQHRVRAQPRPDHRLT